MATPLRLLSLSPPASAAAGHTGLVGPEGAHVAMARLHRLVRCPPSSCGRSNNGVRIVRGVLEEVFRFVFLRLDEFESCLRAEQEQSLPLWEEKSRSATDPACFVEWDDRLTPHGIVVVSNNA